MTKKMQVVFIVLVAMVSAIASYSFLKMNEPKIEQLNPLPVTINETEGTCFAYLMENGDYLIAVRRDGHCVTEEIPKNEVKLIFSTDSQPHVKWGIRNELVIPPDTLLVFTNGASEGALVGQMYDA